MQVVLQWSDAAINTYKAKQWRNQSFPGNIGKFSMGRGKIEVSQVRARF